MYETKFAIAAQSAALGQISRVPVSLTGRLDYLRRGVERATLLRRQLNNITEQLEPMRESVAESPDGPSPDGMSERFGEALSDLHRELDCIENLARRIEVSLFGDTKERQATQTTRG